MTSPSGQAVRRVIRFCIVGAVATGSYFCIYLICALALSYPSTISNAIAWVMSIAASYLGHKAFTYRASGSDMKYFPRFISVSVSLLVFYSAGTMIFEGWLARNPITSAIFISLTYPLLSFLANELLVFKESRIS